MVNERETLDEIVKALRNYDRKGCEALVRKALDNGMNPATVMDALMVEIEETGKGFSRGDLFLPELVGAGNAVEGSMKILNEAILRNGVQRGSLGVVVIGTVFGDIHTIGKSMVSTLLTASGFTVYDLGINVPVEEFVSAVDKYNPDILAMSALLTTTAREQKLVIEALKAKGLRDKTKVLVGGGAVTEEYAASIGADGYASSAPLAVDMAKQLIETSN
jgi:methanogenic corrinoid protein MtbC1